MQTISPTELKEWMAKQHNFVLIDVREEWEREAFNIGGIHIPLGDLMQQKDQLPKEGDVVLYCEKGIRSGIAIQRLEHMGYHNLINLAGGMKAWKASL